ncbi:MAG TPA: glycosyltransferase family 9 protein [Kiritimatiellia bacterium]|nr:glycosyltransferase family 9 protein [Kiritimatiellia bacterium]
MNRILVIKLSSLGDLFHALPAVHRIHRHTGAVIDWVCHDIYVDLVRHFGPVHRVIGFPRRSFAKRGRDFLRMLREEEYDLALDFQGLLKSAFVTRAARAGRRVGPSFSREGSRFFYDEVSGPTNKNRHAVDECLDTARLLGCGDQPVEFPIEFPVFPLDLPRPRIGLLPCSRRAEKNWPVARFAEVARALRARASASLLVLGGPADAGPCAALTAAIGEGAHNWCGRTSMIELGGLIRELDLLITVDSGPMHVAAAVGTPTVAVFGPTDPVRTGPYGPAHRVIRQGPDLAQLPAAPVLAAALELLG